MTAAVAVALTRAVGVVGCPARLAAVVGLVRAVGVVGGQAVVAHALGLGLVAAKRHGLHRRLGSWRGCGYRPGLRRLHRQAAPQRTRRRRLRTRQQPQAQYKKKCAFHS